jgi:hypothetical protein
MDRSGRECAPAPGRVHHCGWRPLSVFARILRSASRIAVGALPRPELDAIVTAGCNSSNRGATTRIWDSIRDHRCGCIGHPAGAPAVAANTSPADCVAIRKAWCQGRWPGQLGAGLPDCTAAEGTGSIWISGPSASPGRPAHWQKVNSSLLTALQPSVPGESS